LRLEIPTPRNLIFSMVLGVYLALWLIGALAVAPVFYAALFVFSGSFPAILFPLALNLLWAGLYLLIWALVAYVWVRATFGVERVRVTPHSLEVTTKRLWLERTEKFDAEQIGLLRLVPVTVPRWVGVLLGGQPSLAFDAGAQTVRFGRGLDEAEARLTFERILEKFPAYRSSVAVGGDLLKARLRDAEQSA
jgi:hypothetical protein